jgi:type IX secretion system PorP/SprF family membrane protein
MLKRLAGILLIIIIFSSWCIGQDTDPEPSYQMIIMNNPAYSGSEGAGTLRLSYLNFYPGNNYNLHSAYLSYDSYFPALHGGAGFFITDNYLGGIINDLKGGLSYSYFLRAGKDLFVNAGLSGSFYHRGYNFGDAILPEQIDPLGVVTVLPQEILANSGHTVFDMGAGVLIISGKFSGGFSISHLAEPDLSGTGSYNELLKRKYLLHMSGDIDLKRTRNLKIRPQVYAGLQGEFISAGAGAALESEYLSINAMVIGDNWKNMNIQTGFAFKSGRVSIYYNYRLNVVSGNNLMPLSLLHQTGLSFCLTDVDKRNVIKTINLPKL